MDNTEKIVLGSGKLYVAEYSGGAIPEDVTLEVDSNRLGDIKGGCSISYTPTFYDVSDDLGLVKKTFLTNEEVKLTSGVLTWNGKTLEKLCSTARVSESGSKRTVKIGGITKFNDKSYVVRFVSTQGHRVTIIGSNKGTLEFAYNPSTETVINVEFNAQAMDAEGTLVEFVESIAG